MKNTAKCLVFFLVLSFFCNGQGSAQSSEDAKFQKMVDDYLDGFWKFYPTAATLAGYNKYNDKIEDLSGGVISKRHEALDAFNQQLVTKVDRSKLSQDNSMIHNIMVDALDLEFVRFENLLPWEYNPLFYNDILFNSVHGLLTSEYAPLDARIKSATERAKQLPGLIKKAKENLKTPARIYTETAIRQLPGIIDFYKIEVPGLTASSTAKNGLQNEAVKVIAALEDYQRFLKNELLPKSSGNFRLGLEAHRRILRMRSQGSIPQEELAARSAADVKNIRREMFLVGIPFYRIMYPNINLEQLTTQRGEEEVKNIVIRGVLDKIKTEHPTKADFVSAISASASKIKSFVAANKLFDVPETNLIVEALPAASQGIAWTKLIAPGGYMASGDYRLQIQPVLDSWTEAQATSFLEENNNFYLDFLTVEKVFPGTFVPTYFTRQDPSAVKKLFANQALLQGWPIFVEEMLVHSGYGSFDLRMRLNQLKLLLKDVMDFQLELNIHQGGMTQDQAMKYMMLSGFQTEVEAERKWNQIILNPGDAALPYIGYQEILDLSKDFKKLKGDAYNEKDFVKKLVSFGAIPLRDLKTKLAQ